MDAADRLPGSQNRGDKDEANHALEGHCTDKLPEPECCHHAVDSQCSASALARQAHTPGGRRPGRRQCRLAGAPAGRRHAKAAGQAGDCRIQTRRCRRTGRQRPARQRQGCPYVLADPGRHRQRDAAGLQGQLSAFQGSEATGPAQPQRPGADCQQGLPGQQSAAASRLRQKAVRRTGLCLVCPGACAAIPRACCWGSCSISR